MSVISQFFFNTFRALASALLPDSLFSKVALLLKGDMVSTAMPADNGTLLDMSSPANPVVKVGTPSHTSFSPFSVNGWSAYFNGSSDRITSSANAAFALGTGNYTMEAWINPSSYSSIGVIVAVVGSSGGSDMILYLNSTGKLVASTSVAGARTSTATIARNIWTHVALVRTNPTTLSLYINGVLDGTVAFAHTLTSNIPVIGGTSAGSFFTGYISNARISNAALYTAAFSPQVSSFIAYPSTLLLTCNDSSFVDSSPSNRVLNIVGAPVATAVSNVNVIESTPTKYFSGKSAYFNGSSFVAFDNTNNRFSLGTTDATIEFWLNFQAAGAVCSTYRWNIGARSGWEVLVNVNGSITIFQLGGNAAASAAGLVSMDTWTHVAITKTGSTVNFWKNGTLFSTATSLVDLSAPTVGPNYLRVGAHTTDNDAIESALTGYIFDLKISNSALYTASFSPVKATSNANTLLLMSADGRLKDLSSAALSAIEMRGSVYPSLTSPLPDTTGLVLGSTYFKGNSDYASISNPALATGTGAFTIETWIYPIAWNGCLTSSWFSTNSGNGFYLGLTSTGTVEFYIGNASGAVGVTNNVCTTSLIAPKSAWTHVAATRSSGGVMTIYINGSLAATTTTSRSIDKTVAFINATYTNSPTLSTNTVSYSGFRISNIARTTFSVAETILPDANTIFQLRNNLAIVDSISSNILYQVGAVSTSTNQSKFGSSSILLNSTSGNRLSLPAYSPSAILGSSDFTIEAWVYPFYQSGTQILYCGQGDGASVAGSSFVTYISAAGATSDLYIGTSGFGAASPNPAPLQWSHVAYVRNGTSWKTYLNGTQVGTTTLAANAVVNVGAPTYPASIGYSVGSNSFSGYIDDFRVTKGIARYTANFSVPTSAFSETTALDANRKYVTCLLHGEQQQSISTNVLNNSTIYDRGPNKYPITRSGSPTLGTNSPFFPSVGSTLFSNSAMALEVPDNNAWNISSFSDYTAEAWVNNTSFNTFNSIFSQSATNNRAWALLIGGGTYVRLHTTADGVNDVNNDFAFTFQTNVWYHIAVTKTGTLYSVYVNGNRIGQANIATVFNSTRPLTIGQFGNFGLTTHAMSGYISNLRIVAGANVYGTGTTLTVPTATLTAITNTALLTCVNGIHKDYSSNNFEITSFGVPTTSAVSPFASGISYDSSIHGSSIGFAQTDRLTIPAASSNTTLTGNFTVSAWVKPDLYTASSLLLVDARTTGNQAQPWIFYLKAAAGAYVLDFYNAGDYVSTGKVALGGWQHVAVSRVGTNLLFFINGKLDSTVAFTSAPLVGASNIITIGSKDSNASSFSGQVTDLHIVNGTAIYTANFTLPTAPQTPVSGTTLLLNGSTPGVTDLSGNNLITTVGSASTSTVVSKYGSSSLAFNGTSDYLSMPPKAHFNLTQGDWTIEAWVYFTSLTNNTATIFDKDGVFNASYAQYNCGLSGGKISLGTGNGNGLSPTMQFFTGTTTVAINTWYHIAAVRSGATIRLFVNGVQEASGTQTVTMVEGNKPLLIGYAVGQPAAMYFPGYIDDLRITKGVARYTANFTVPDSLPQF